jgi:hypothetical protein
VFAVCAPQPLRILRAKSAPPQKPEMYRIRRSSHRRIDLLPRCDPRCHSYCTLMIACPVRVYVVGMPGKWIGGVTAAVVFT